MTITITTVPHNKQRYRTVGDWIFDGFGNLQINVSDTGNGKFNSLIALHELIEALLCRFNNPEITTEMVDDFDMNHLDLDEPGADRKSPYHWQHRKAEVFEFLLASNLKIDWKEYSEAVGCL